MEANRFDHLARSFNHDFSRRGLLGGLATSIGLATISVPSTMVARNKKKLKRNAFGCVDVGGKCQGKDAVCCSGICKGKKPRKGEKDNSRCVAHDTGGCPAGLTRTFCGGSADVPCITTTGLSGTCLTTTGNGGYCFFDSSCRQCRRDADCQADFGPRAACVDCTGCPDATACAVPDNTIED